ncbi:MAG: rhodanese-like domain-containing protein [Flavobacteriales bacterium]
MIDRPSLFLICSFLLITACEGNGSKKRNSSERSKSDTAQTVKNHKKGKKEGEPWTQEQLLPPSRLAKMLEDSSSELPLICCVGPEAMIPRSEHFGEAHKDSALKAFKKKLEGLSKDRSLVIYCGCCPFEDCPNIRPAFRLLNEKGFRSHRLLGLSRSLKADWIDQGYPVREVKGRSDTLS